MRADWVRPAAICLLGLAPVVVPAAPSGSLEYTVSYERRLVGGLSVSRQVASRHIAYGYSVNGRGPKLEFDFTLDSSRLPRTLRVSGVDTLQVAAEETLKSNGRLSDWHSPVDTGVVQQGVFYASFYQSPEGDAMLARALLAAKEKTLLLAPAGTARLEMAQERHLSAGARTVSVRLYLITGVDFAPIALWLTDDRELFAKVDSGLSVIRKGWESQASLLREAQKQVLDTHDAATATRLQSHPQGPVLFEHALVFDADAGRMRKDTSVLVNGNRIFAVGRDGTITFPADTQKIDAAGAALLPGLWDMHVHLRDNVDGMLNIVNGITTVRDMGNTLDNITNWRARYAAGELIGPRILPAGLIDGVGPNTTNGVHVATAEQLSTAITSFADNGYIEIKLYSSFPKELIPEAVREAHSRGLRVGGHVPVGLRLEDVVRLGFDDVSHFNFVMLNFLGDAVQNRTNTLARVLEPAAHAGSIDLDSPAVTRMIDAMRDRHVVLDSTALVFENLFGAKPGTMRAALAPYGDRLPARITRDGRGGGLAKTDEERATYTESFDHMLPLLKRMHDAGIAIVPGTDGEPGVLLARELELYVKAGLSPGNALQMATLVPARMMRLDQDLGSIAPGKLADLFLVDGDPSQDISTVRNVRLVVRNGAFYDAAALDEAIGIRPTLATH